MAIDFQQVRELLAAIAQTDVTEFSLKSDDFELTVKKGSGVAQPMIVADATVTPMSMAVPNPIASPPVAIPEPTPPPTAPTNTNWVEVTSPMVGTFYRAPAPDEPPFVAIGDTVTPSQTVCIIEAMKLMNEIEAEATGKVMEILVENGESVEFGQPLMRIEPS
ncbi:MAG: acetyl-CoA carboxylase biotin carboxyl carrier protein [Spirulina sp. SIO3F2]|nr:acetyl-CoA carboxylase biotin carboxyl carrier protein [Spirulina sp. SIO3F2]